MALEKNYNIVKGAFFIILAAFFFALMNLFVALSGDLPAVQKSFFRNCVAVVIALGLVLKSKESNCITKGSLKDLILRSGFGTIGILCNFYAVDHLVLADASMLNKMAPFFAVIFSYLFLREKITLRQFLTIVVAFIGALFIVKPSMHSLSFLPAFIGLCGGIAAGAAYTMVRKLGTQNIQGPFVVLFFSAFSCIVTGPFLLFDYHPMSSSQLLALLGAGLCASFAQFAVTTAYFSAPAKEISVFDYSQVLFSALLGFFIFNQIPDLFSLIGYLIIIGVAFYMFFQNRKAALL